MHSTMTRGNAMLGRWGRLAIIACLVLLPACSRAKPGLPQGTKPAPPAEAEPALPLTPTPSLLKPGFELAHPPGARLSYLPEADLTVTIENCGEEPSLRVFQDTRAYEAQCDVQIESATIDVNPYRVVLQAIVREAYSFADVQTTVPGSLDLVAQPRATTTFTLRWEQIWDANSISVVIDGQGTDSVPVRVLMGLRLVQVATQEVPCGPQTAPTRIVGLPVVISPEGREPGGERSEDALELVRAYVEHLSAQEWKQAYDLLNASGQSKVPFERYVAGYEPVRAIEIGSVVSRQVNDTAEQVVVALTITLRKGGVDVASEWRATYDVVRLSDDGPHGGHRIAAVKMKKTGAQ